MAVVLGFDAVMLYTCGWKALAYLLIGTVMGGGLHPMAGHLIAEHYMFAKVLPPAPLEALFCCRPLLKRAVSKLCQAGTPAASSEGMAAMEYGS